MAERERECLRWGTLEDKGWVGAEEEGGTNGKAGMFKKRATSKEQEMTNVGYGRGGKHEGFLPDTCVNF